MQLTQFRVTTIAAALLLGISLPAVAQEEAETTTKPNPAEESIQKPDTTKPEATTKTNKAKPDEAKTDETKTDDAAGTEAAVDASKMVRVNVSAVRDSLATQLQVAAPTIPEFVLAEPDVAGEVCSVAPNTLLANIESGTEARCTAVTTSQALRVAVQKQLTAG